ncbi:hypothetical protein LWI29_019059 [Acer saccharum]|uniref:DM2 domain-containing protein n=1 Tax=Acer saccharum TaxID=4024 RepID=A0AA39RE69_ACESA|nr:hypothetical protein LWI29_019059 [Acer saccharum]
MKRKKKKLNKELVAEDWCFVCKDGGSLRICDYGQMQANGDKEENERAAFAMKERLSQEKEIPDGIRSEDGTSESEFQLVIFDDDTYRCKQIGRRKRMKGQLSVERKAKSNKKKFIGWGSESLLEFLASIGKDTSIEMSQYAVMDIIIEYCKKNKLFDPEIRKKINFDARLQALLGRNLQLLQKPEEQLRLLREVPEVIADDVDLEPVFENVMIKDEQEQNNGSSESALGRTTETPCCDFKCNGTSCCQNGATDAAGIEARDACNVDGTKELESDLSRLNSVDGSRKDMFESEMPDGQAPNPESAMRY